VKSSIGVAPRVPPGGYDVVFDDIGEESYSCSFAALERGDPRLDGYSAGVQAQGRMLSILIWK
jgi:hypothetical protein